MKSQIMISRRMLSFLVTGTVAAFVLFGYVAHQSFAKESGKEESYRLLKTFTDVLALIDKNYVTEVNVKDLIEGAIKGMIYSLDPHSSYLPPEGYKELQVETKGEFGGLGIEITVKDGLLTVVAAIEDSPASRAGLEAGDQIVKIGDEFTRELSINDAIKKMRGLKGTPVTISVHREGTRELLPFTVIRDVIKVKSVRNRMLEDGYGYVRLAQFQEGSASEFADALETLKKEAKAKALKGLVLDLRNDPGGLLTQAIRVADLFLKSGTIVYTEGRLDTQKQRYDAHDDGDEPAYPIVVLVNGGSASASEIVAGALQDSRRALIVGSQTFGKGSVQTILPMEGGSALRLTTALYFTSSGRSIQAQGITPDIVVSGKRFPSDSEEFVEEEEVGPRRERDLPGAIKNPQGAPGDAAKERGKETPEGKPQKSSSKEPDYVPGSRSAMALSLEQLLKADPQLQEALRLIKSGRATLTPPEHTA